MTLPVIVALGFVVGFYSVTLYAITRSRRLTGRSPVILFQTGTAEEKTSFALLVVFPLVFLLSVLAPDRPLTRALVERSWLAWIGALLFAGGLILHVVALRTLGAAFQIGIDPSRTPGIVRTGPYRLIRHPVYAAFLAYFVGAWMVTPNLLFTIVTPLAAARVILQARHEEAALTAAFGRTYTEYMRTTARFIPGVF